MDKPVVFGKFCLLERISVGGMAEVYRAKPLDAPSFDKFLAIKKILPNLAQDNEFIEMFIDEAKIAVQLTHRNICQIYELGRLDDAHYIVMEFIGGRDVLAIQNRMRREKRIMSVGQSGYLARQIAEGLDAAHRKTDENGSPLNIIHRDVSPQNVLVSYTGEVKIIDFGIAKAATRSNKTQVGVLKGKFGYMSPEQVRGLPLDHRSDIFALGTLFHEMLTCRRLFFGESDFSILEKVRKADVAPPSKHNPNVPPEIDDIVLKALARDPDDRFQTCAEMADELDNFLAKLRPPYTERTLEGWMQRTFAEELQKEREKRRFFAQFTSITDIEQHNAAVNAELMERLGVGSEPKPDPADLANERTMIWDGEGPQVAEEPAPNLPDMATRIVTDWDPDAPVPGAPLPPPSQNILHTGPLPALSSEPAPVPAAPGAPPRSLGATLLKISAVGVFFVVGFSVVALAGYFLLFGGFTGAGVMSPGELVISTSPVQDVDILVNGKLRATQTPFVLKDLEAGNYTVEARHAEFLPSTRLVRVRRGDRLDVALELERRPVGHGQLTVIVKPSDARLYVDGKQTALSSVGSATVEVDDQRPHLIEAVAPGFVPTELRVEVVDGQKLTKRLNLDKADGAIELSSTPTGTIYLNGNKMGRAPLTLSNLDPWVMHEVEIRYPGYAPWRKQILFDRSLKKTFSASLRRGRDDDAEPGLEVGYVVVPKGKTWWRVSVDGFDIGRTTPIPRDKKLILPVGEHKISFRRGDTTHERKVQIRADRVEEVRMDEEFVW